MRNAGSEGGRGMALESATAAPSTAEAAARLRAELDRLGLLGGPCAVAVEASGAGPVITVGPLGLDSAALLAEVLSLVEPIPLRR
jgi:hypothetical protein